MRSRSALILLSLALAACATARTRAGRVCGPEGTVDMDPQGASDRPVPHCNRNGWNGHRYTGVKT